MITANTTNTATNAATQTASTLSKTLSSQALSQGDFLKLLVTQVKNQDPTKPMDSTQFVSQLAQFSALAGVTELNTTMTGVAQHLQANQLIQGTSLVGHQVLAPGQVGELSETFPLTGAVNLPISTSSVSIRIQDTTGNVVQTLDLGSQNSGMIPFSWDGLRSDGQPAPVGPYRIEASYLQDGQSVAADTLVAARVNSVSLDSSGLLLQVQNIGEIPLSSISMLM